MKFSFHRLLILLLHLSRSIKLLQLLHHRLPDKCVTCLTIYQPLYLLTISVRSIVKFDIKKKAAGIIISKWRKEPSGKQWEKCHQLQQTLAVSLI